MFTWVVIWSVLGILFFICLLIGVIVSFSNRTKMAEFAMMGGKINFIKEQTDLDQWQYRKYYITTDDTRIADINSAHKYQKTLLTN